MNRLNLVSRFALVLAVFAAMLNKADAQCSITAQGGGSASADGCAGSPVSLCVTGIPGGSSDSIVWDFGGTGTAKGSCVTNVWTSATGGAVTITVRVYKNGVEICTPAPTHNITVHALPVPKFALKSPTPQCFKGNAFTFEDQTTTPSGNPIVKREFLTGDGQIFINPSVPNMGPFRYIPPTNAGGFFDPVLRVTDSKGCVADVTYTSLIQIKPNLGLSFTSPNPKRCDSTPVTLTNTSLIPQANVQSFRWDFGDGKGVNTTNWTNPKHTFFDSGCFTGSLIVTATDGCSDTAKGPAACNVKVILHVSVPNGDVQCFQGQNYVFVHPPIQGATFNWNFDDIPSGLLNNDNKNWSAAHDFMGAGPYDVTFRMSVVGCIFDTVYRVHVKGPAAGIETKPAPLIANSQRYQCKIKDTVFFPNISTYYFNDDSAYNDFYYTVKGAIFQFIDDTKFHIDFDTFNITGTKQNVTTKTGRKVYVSPAGDTVGINTDTLIFAANILVKGTRTSFVDKFYAKNSHTTRVWDFADQFAPKCTTDSRPIYPKDNAKYGNGHMTGPGPYPAWTYDSQGRWYNCNFNRDSLPKHMYTPGREQCYAVRLTLKDTSKADPNIEGLTASNKDPLGCESVATVNLALQGPNANGLRWQGIPCYGPANVYGFFYDFSRTGPGCDREFFWIHLDSLADRVDATPNVFDKWIPQTGTVVDRLFTPWPMATMSLPPNVGRVFWQYQPNGAYPSKIADKAGWATIGFRVQNGIDPITGQPCIDEKWYDSAYRYINSNPAFKFYDPKKPDSTYTFQRICTPNDVHVKRDSTVLDLLKGTYTYSSDSIGAEIWAWGDDEMEIDSFYRYVCPTSTCYSYIKRFRIVGNGAPIQTDSILTRIYDGNLGISTFVDARDSTPDILRQHRYTKAAWNRVSHTLVPCQKVPFDSVGITVYRNSCCDNPPFENVRVAISGFQNDLRLSDSIVCRNQPIQFFDSARYFLEFPIIVPPYIIDGYDYWRTPTQDAAGNFRPKPNKGQYEAYRWDFGDGLGWNSSVPQDPTRSYPEPGDYIVKLEYTDSLGCKELQTRNVKVTGVSGNFTFNRKMSNCQPIVDFMDTSLMLDPCRLTSGRICDSIVGWSWNFGDNKGNNQSISIVRNPSKLYTSFGDFEVVLVVQTKLGCKDSIKRTISLEGPRPRFEFAADSVGCVPFTVELRNTSINPTPQASWTWYFGDGNFVTTKGDSNMVHTYTKPGTYEIFMLQTDHTPLNASGLPCDAFFPDTANTFGNYRKFIVRVLPTRAVDFTMSDSILCRGDSVVFRSVSDTVYTNFRWIFHNFDTVVHSNVQGKDTTGHKYDVPGGTYYIQLRPTYVPDPGDPTCLSSQVKKVLVKEVDAVLQCDTTQMPFIYFKNSSVNAANIFWDFGTGNGFEPGNNMPDFPNAKYNYGENKGFYTVFLAVESPEGCKDTAWCQFLYDYKVEFNPVNVFTPGNGDNLNDFFDVRVLNEEKYELFIFNRWGEKVFVSENKDAQWDGKHIGTGAECPTGVYFVVINYRLRGDGDKTYRGTLSLLRK